jgi:hypothetical protein
MCNEIDINIMFPYIVALQWIIVNTIGTFIILILLYLQIRYIGNTKILGR